ncbi:AraC family transcriptional regulator ligand-binding domain-containing protein [Candidatus Uabimicrobium sp. HlEnr_7]|uniref:AraC family transcriptional regulator n=1 Tax=Candidatus Uabimicrobium helgolandensis TaxID=3095367 RepID=UPI0035584953
MIAQTAKFPVDPAWRVTLKDLGIEESNILRRAQLPNDLFSRENFLLTTQQYFRLWESLGELFSSPIFPLQLGQTVPAESFNPSVFAALCSPCLNIAMKRLSHYQQLIGPLILTINEDEKTTTVSFDCLYTDYPMPDIFIATKFVFLVHLVRLATRENIKPLFISSTTRLLNHSDYTQYFGITPMHSSENKLQFCNNDAKRPFLTENQNMWQFFEPELKKRLTEMDTKTPFSLRVHSCLFKLLPSGFSSVDDVAEKLAISKRSLQRYLNNENTNFQVELKNVRERLAKHYLTTTSLSNTQISFLLGFSSSNSFVRAFRSWTGKTPQRIRKEKT